MAASPLPSIHRLRPDLFYGWYVVAAAFVLGFISVGIGFYGQTVFLDGLIHEKGWSKAGVSGASTLFFTMTGVSGVAVGRAVDRWGSRKMLVAGALTMATALLWLGGISTPAELYVVYALLAASFAMSAAIPLSGLVNRWFLRQRSRAMSFAQTGVSVGGLVLVPVATELIATSGFRSATTMLAVLVLAVAIPIAILVVRDAPEPYGLEPDDGHDPALPPPAAAPHQEHMWRARDAVRTRTFVLMAASFAAILLCQTGVAVHHLHLLRQHMSTTQAAFGAAAIPLGSIIGRLISGAVADRIEKRVVSSALFAIQAAAILALSFAAQPIALLGTSLLFGLTIGAVFMLQGLLTAELFGLRSYGTVFGSLNLVTGIGGGLGPLVIGLLADATGGYSGALRWVVVLAPLAAFGVARVRAPQPPAAAR